MKITLTTPIQIDFPNPISGQTEQKIITKLNISHMYLDYNRSAIILSATYEDDNNFRAATHNSYFGSKAVDPVLNGADFTTLEAAGVNQTEVYSLLQSKYAFLAGSVS